MLAIQMTRFGGPDVLEAVTLETPEPGPGQVLVAVEYASVTFVETQLRAGRPPRAGMEPELPTVPGNGVGGAIVALGAGVTAELWGRRVVSSLSGRGGYAEYAVADAASIVPVPDVLATDRATALLADGRTARALLDAARAAMPPEAPPPGATNGSSVTEEGDERPFRASQGAATPLTGRRVLVAPAGGGVGTLLVSLLARDGARVIAAAGSPYKLDLARSRGAWLTVNYRDDGWTRTVRREAGGVDLVLDGVGGGVGSAALTLVVPGGFLCRFGAAGGELGPDPAQAGRAEVLPITLGPLSPADQRRLVGEALDDAAAGGVGPVVGRRFPLADAADAHRAIEDRATIGKTLLVAR